MKYTNRQLRIKYEGLDLWMVHTKKKKDLTNIELSFMHFRMWLWLGKNPSLDKDKFFETYEIGKNKQPRNHCYGCELAYRIKQTELKQAVEPDDVYRSLCTWCPFNWTNGNDCDYENSLWKQWWYARDKYCNSNNVADGTAVTGFAYQIATTPIKDEYLDFIFEGDENKKIEDREDKIKSADKLIKFIAEQLNQFLDEEKK